MRDTKITVETDINLPLANVWEYYSDPKHETVQLSVSANFTNR